MVERDAMRHALPEDRARVGRQAAEQLVTLGHSGRQSLPRRGAYRVRHAPPRNVQRLFPHPGLAATEQQDLSAILRPSTSCVMCVYACTHSKALSLQMSA